MSKYREFRDGYWPIREHNTLVFMGAQPVAVGKLREWSVANGHAIYVTSSGLPVTCRNKTGFTVDFGLGKEEQRKIDPALVVRALIDIRNRQRSDWPVDARDICNEHEARLFKVFDLLDEALDENETQAVEAAALKTRLSGAELAKSRAETAADEMAKRLRACDPDRIRREAEAVLLARIEKAEGEARRLASELHEATSQVTKLAEDKRRLRAALNTRR